LETYPDAIPDSPTPLPVYIQDVLPVPPPYVAEEGEITLEEQIVEELSEEEEERLEQAIEDNESGVVGNILKKAANDNERMDEELHGKPTRRRPQTFRLGDTVRIVSGPFVSFTGKIEGINQDKALLKVKVAIYGRNKPIKLNFADVENVTAS